MELINNIPVFGTPTDEGALKQIAVCAETADLCALMPDNHKGYAVPIGGVVAYEDRVSPSAVGYDIGCGNKAIRTDFPVEELRKNISGIMDEVWRQISFGVGRNNNEPLDHPIFDADHEGWRTEPAKSLKQMARNQLSSCGGGNHYLDILVDELNRVWVGCHFGSRGLGHKIATHFLKAAGAKDGMDVAPCVLEVNSDLGAQYIAAMELGGEYAYAGRDLVCDRVARILGASVLEEVHNHHNFAWKEKIGDKDYWVCRKGATPAFPGQKGFVGGSMGDISVILEGVESPLSKYTLNSTVHGAGRRLGRAEAKGKFKDGEWKRAPKVTQEMMDEWVKKAGVELRGGDIDESPHCYKRIEEVLAQTEGTIRVIHTLKPVGVAMASKDTFDPYKD